MSITSTQITHLARLARLDVSAEDADSHARQLTRILELVEQMNRINTDGIQPMSHPQEAALRLRDDRPCPSPDPQARRDHYQRIAPTTEQGLYLAPRVIE